MILGYNMRIVILNILNQFIIKQLKSAYVSKDLKKRRQKIRFLNSFFVQTHPHSTYLHAIVYHS
jgi:hypothetical protein